jgi:hypothetical protein
MRVLRRMCSLVQLDGKVAFFHADIRLSSRKGLPEASLGTKFSYQVKVFKAGTPIESRLKLAPCYDSLVGCLFVSCDGFITEATDRSMATMGSVF